VKVVRDFAEHPPFELHLPERFVAPVLIDSPHSGAVYPEAFLRETRLDRLTIRRSEDAHVDALCLPSVARGIALLRAHFPRAYLDANREALELDPTMFVGPLPEGANITSPRVAGGLGTVPRIVSDRDEIYGAPIPIEDGIARIDTLWRPYHHTLGEVLERIRARFGVVVLIDCHSMPTVPRAVIGDPRAEVILGDRNGISCDPRLTDLVSALFRDAGYRVARNKPYAGGHITERYGRPARGIHALQIEMARSLYMNETTMARTAGFARLQRDLDRIFGELVATWHTLVDRDALAAE
jgi:N-formylglutamate amidohydrolase